MELEKLLEETKIKNISIPKVILFSLIGLHRIYLYNILLGILMIVGLIVFLAEGVQSIGVIAFFWWIYEVVFIKKIYVNYIYKQIEKIEQGELPPKNWRLVMQLI